MSRKRLLITIAITGFVIAILVFIWVFRPADKNVSSKKADIEISAKELVQHFETDEAAANINYIDKIVMVTGKVESISDDGAVITVSLKNADDISGVLCSFDKNSVESDLLQEGKEVKIKGVCTGYLMDVVLTKCSIEE